MQFLRASLRVISDEGAVVIFTLALQRSRRGENVTLPAHRPRPQLVTAFLWVWSARLPSSHSRPVRWERLRWGFWGAVTVEVKSAAITSTLGM